MACFAGFDPGLKGGFAIVGEKAEILFQSPMPVIKLSGKSSIDFRKISSILKDYDPDLTVIERVHSMPGQGVSSTFTFGMGFGGLIGVCSALDYSFMLALPGEWQSKILQGIDKKLKKARSIVYCQDRYPAAEVRHDGIADALCIALYGRHQALNTHG